MTFAEIFPEFIKTGNPITRKEFEKDFLIKKGTNGRPVFYKWVNLDLVPDSLVIELQHLTKNDWKFVN